jgi:hypothetical protein
MVVSDTCPPSFEHSKPLRNTGKGVNIFLKGSEKSMGNFGCIFSFVREEFDDYGLPDFRVHRIINLFEGLGGGNAFLRETQGRSGESGNGI